MSGAQVSKMPSLLMRFLSYKLPAKTEGTKAAIVLAGFIKRSQFDLNQRNWYYF